MKNRLNKKDKLYYKEGGFFDKVGKQINTGIANVKDTTISGTFGEIGDSINNNKKRLTDTANNFVNENTNFKNVNELGAEALKYGKDAAVIGGLGAVSMTGIGMPIQQLTGKSLDNLVGYEAETKAGKLAQRGTQTYAQLQGMATPMMANIVAPGSGAAVKAAQQGISGIPALNNPNQAQSFIPQGMEGALSSSLGMAGQFMENGGKLVQFKGGIKGKTDSIEIMPGVMVNHGETAIKTPDGNLVINSKSDKVKLMLDGKDPAKESKRIEKLGEFRKNDLLTQNMTNKLQNRLSKISEHVGSLLNPDAAGYQGMEEYKYGGIHIAENKKGTFTAAATKHGKSVQAFASQVLANKDNYSPAMVKKANFARNAAKWHHEDGGMLRYDDGGEYDSETTTNEFEQLGGTGTSLEPNLNMVEDSIDNTPTTYVPERISATVDANGNPITPSNYSKYLPYATLGLGAIAKSIPQIQELRRLKKDKPENVAYNRIKYNPVTASTLDPRAALAQAAQENRTNDYNMRQASAGNLGSYLSNMSAARLANARNKTNINYEYDKANAGILNQNNQFNAANRLNTEQYNADIGDKELDVNSQTRANYENQMYKLRQGLGDNAASALNTANTQYFGDKFNQNTNQQNAAMYGSLYNTPEFQAFIKNNPKYFTT